MHCELVVTGLLSGSAEMRVGALELLLARGRQQRRPARTLEAWLQEVFELEGASFPAGALTVLAAGGDPADARWTRADPVHLRVMRDRVAMVSEGFGISEDEARTLSEAINRHFAGQLEVSAPEPRYWCARLEGNVALNDALINEVQMLLHAQPVNETREARGELAINSLSFWGEGRAPARARSRWQSVVADDPAVRGIARLAAARHRPLPRSAQDWLDRLPEDGRHLAVLDARQAPLADLEQHWFAPLLAALRAQRVGMVTVHVPDGAEEVSFETIRGDLRRFWRRAKPIEHYA
jgi:hypothetical protein